MLFFDNCQIFEAYAAGKRTSAKSCAVLSGRNRGGEVFFRQKGTERHASRVRLGDGDDVGNHTEALESEQLACASEAALDLVEDERGVVMVGKRSAGEQEFLGTLEDPAFTKDGLEHNRAGIGTDRGVQRFEVVLFHEGHIFEHRLKALAIFFLAGK